MRHLLLKRGTAKFLQLLVVLIAAGALAFMLREPHLEGRNAHATLFAIYFQDPFLAYAYLASVPFFAALHQTYQLLGHAGQDYGAVSPATVRALRRIKHCAIAMIAFATGGELIILIQESDDRAGGIVIGLIILTFSAALAALASKLERVVSTALQSGPVIPERQPQTSTRATN
jgi:hypothetical protein